MAANKNLPGPEPIRYYVDYSHRLSWRKLDTANNYWAIYYLGQHVGEMFKGKSGWIGLVFASGSEPSAGFVCQKRGDCMRHVAGRVLNPSH